MCVCIYLLLNYAEHFSKELQSFRCCSMCLYTSVSIYLFINILITIIIWYN